MKKLYMLTLACILGCMAISQAQTRYWAGPVNGNWNNPANWSDGSNTGVSVPNGPTFIAIFNAGTPVVNVDIANFELLSLVVTNNTTAKLYTSTGTSLALRGTASPDYALRIDAGSRLEDSAAASGSFNMNLVASSNSLVNGTWYLAAHPDGIASIISVPTAAGGTTLLDVNGTIILGHKAVFSTLSPSTNYIHFNANSELLITRNGGSTPHATWNASSTIRITGAVDGVAAINGPATFSVGNLVFDCPNMNIDLGWGLPTGMTVAGNLQIVNTNNKNLTLAFSSAGAPTALVYNVTGNLEIGNNAWVTLGNSNNLADKSCELQVNGNFIQSGGRFDLRGSSITSATLPTSLKVRGNFTQTAGTFGCASTATGIDLFVVELNGTANQLVDLVSNTIDNPGNQVTFQVNKASGTVILQRSLAVGRLRWTGSKGIINANNNTLTVNNPVEASIAGYGPNAYISGGTITRTTTTVEPYVLPTGGATYRPATITPTDADPSVYSARYNAGAYSTLAVSTPLSKVSNAEYWDIARVSGSDARVTLELTGAAVPGVGGIDKLVVAHFNTGTNRWVSAKGDDGTELEPGNSTSGTVTSEVLDNFSPFTFGVLPGAPLPVYLVSFNAKKLSNTSAKLDWVITTNSNPDRFEVLRSEDGISFLPIGTVKATAQQLSFSFLDEQLPKKTAYYQLRMIDQQGLVNMSKIVTVFNNGEGLTINSMIPTLVTSQAKLNISSSSRTNIRLVVTDSYGRIVHQQQAALNAGGSQDIWLNLGRLATGAYQVTGYLDNGTKTSTIRFIRQ